jgi:hypothetical protein
MVEPPVRIQGLHHPKSFITIKETPDTGSTKIQETKMEASKSLDLQELGATDEHMRLYEVFFTNVCSEIALIQQLQQTFPWLKKCVNQLNDEEYDEDRRPMTWPVILVLFRVRAATTAITSIRSSHFRYLNPSVKLKWGNIFLNLYPCLAMME